MQRFEIIHQVFVSFFSHIFLAAHGYRHFGLSHALLQIQGLVVIRFPSFLRILEKHLQPLLGMTLGDAPEAWTNQTPAVRVVAALAVSLLGVFKIFLALGGVSP